MPRLKPCRSSIGRTSRRCNLTIHLECHRCSSRLNSNPSRTRLADSSPNSSTRCSSSNSNSRCSTASSSSSPSRTSGKLPLTLARLSSSSLLTTGSVVNLRMPSELPPSKTCSPACSNNSNSSNHKCKCRNSTRELPCSNSNRR